MNIAHHSVRIPSRGIRLAPALRNGALVAACLLAAAARPAGAAEPADGPIEVRACSPVYAQPAEDVYAMGMVTVAGVEVDYVNRASVVAHDVTFVIGAGTDGIALTDHGSFAPGVLIRRVFWTAPGGTDTSMCRVAAAAFKSGTAYVAPAPANIANR